MPNDNHENDLPMNISDHDLLIVLHTTMKHMARDIASIKDESMQRIAVLEATKFDKDDAQNLNHRIEKEHEKIMLIMANKLSKEDAKKDQENNDAIHADHEERMRKTERTIYIATGALAILQFLLAFAK